MGLVVCPKRVIIDGKLAAYEGQLISEEDAEIFGILGDQPEETSDQPEETSDQPEETSGSSSRPRSKRSQKK